MKYLITAFLILLTLQSCDNSNEINTSEEDENFLLSSVYGIISHRFIYEGNKISKISFILEEMSIKKEIIYNQDNQIEYSINTYEFDDLSVSVDTTFVEYQKNLIQRTTTQKYIENFKITEYFEYDERNRLINVRQERILNTTYNLVYNFIYDEENNVTRLNIPDFQYHLFEYDDKVNPYTQIDLDAKIILGEWTLMNVLSKNNTLAETIIDANTAATNENFEYVYQYNDANLPVSRTGRFDIPTFYEY
tara:strand:- start:1115 stop:1861 length:747 start_codon:yes stop_codon:yes gene_type:complete